MSAIVQWVDVTASLLSILVVTGALVSWTFGRNPLVVHTLNAERHRTLGRALAISGLSRAALRKQIKACTKGYIVGYRAPSIQAELEWLDSIASEIGAEPPVSFYGLPDDELADSQARLADAYVAFARRLRSRGLIGGGTSPLVEELASVAERLAGLLSKHATFAAGDPGPVSGLDLQLAVNNVHLQLDHLREADAPGLGIDDVAVSYMGVRLVVPGTLSERIAKLDSIQIERLLLSTAELHALNAHFTGKTFDGVLPSLRGQRLERDPASGRTRLHLVLAETSFSAVMASHYVGGFGVGTRSSELRGEAGLLTLAILPTTVDGYLVLTTRSAHVSITAGQESPAVTGNLEMRDRTGLTVDRDSDGLPDPLLAIQRECREELGLDLRRDQIQMLASMRFASPQEVGTTVLLTTAAVDLTLQEIAHQAKNADRIEGAWESQDEITGVPIPKDFDDCVKLIEWTVTARNHVPHLAGSLIAYCYPKLCSHFGPEGAAQMIVSATERKVEAAPPSGIKVVARVT